MVKQLDLPALVTAAGTGPLAFLALGVILLGYLAARWFGTDGLPIRMGIFVLLAAVVCFAPFVIKLATDPPANVLSENAGAEDMASPASDEPRLERADNASDKPEEPNRGVTQPTPCPAQHLVGTSTPEGSAPWTVDIDLGSSKLATWKKRDGARATRLVAFSDCEAEDIGIRLIPQDPPDIPTLVCLGTRSTASVEMKCRPDSDGPKEDFVGIFKDSL